MFVVVVFYASHACLPFLCQLSVVDELTGKVSQYNSLNKFHPKPFKVHTWFQVLKIFWTICAFYRQTTFCHIRVWFAIAAYITPFCGTQIFENFVWGNNLPHRRFLGHAMSCC